MNTNRTGHPIIPEAITARGSSAMVPVERGRGRKRVVQRSINETKQPIGKRVITDGSDKILLLTYFADEIEEH